MRSMRTRDRRRAGRIAVIVLIACLLLPFIGGGIVLLSAGGDGVRFESSAPADSTTPFARGIQFVGVQPAGSDDLLDGEGKVIGQMPCLELDCHFHSNQVTRTFLFELPATSEPVHFPGDGRVRPSGAQYRGSGSGSNEACRMTYEGRRLYVHTASIPDHYYEHSAFGGGRVPLDRVDVTLEFFQGPPQPAKWSFRGPFAVGNAYASGGNRSGKLTVLPPQGGQTVRFQFVTSVRAGHGEDHWLIYDTAGKRHMPPMSSGGSYGSGGVNVTCNFSGMALGEIGRIVYGERPQRRTFRNVLVRYADRPDDPYPQDVHKMAAALKRTVKDVANRRIQTAEEALAVVDLVRGQRVQWVRHPLHGVQFDKLPAAQQKRLRDAAARWAAVPVRTVREVGVELGFKWGGGEAFFAAATEMLDSDDRYTRSTGAGAVSRWGNLTPAQIERIRDRLLVRREPNVTGQLLYGLRRCKGEAAAAAFRSLASAPDDRPDLWRGAINALRSRNELADPDKLPRNLRARVLLVTGAGAGDRDVAAAANELLGKLLTPQLLRDDENSFNIMYQALLKRMPQPDAMKVFVGFLRKASAEDFVHDSVRRWAWRMVKQVNLWHDRDFAGFGWDPRPATTWKGGQMLKRDWPGIVGQVVQWYDAGNGRSAGPAPGEPPAGANAREGTFAGGSKNEAFVDLDTGRAFELPTDLQRAGSRYKYKDYDALRKAQKAWRDDNSVDLRVYSGRGYANLTCWLTASPVPTAWWSSATARQVGAALSRSTGQEGLSTRTLGPLPFVLAFRTAAGLEGLAMIVSSDSQRGTTVRWRATSGDAGGSR